MPPLSNLAIAGREVAAYARQALLLPRDVARPSLPRGVAADDSVVVCMHGLFASAGVMQPLRTRLERQQLPTGRPLRTASMTYPPSTDVKRLARRLAELCAALPTRARLHLLGHSLGGIICRYYAQEIGDPRVVQTISIATPFGGVRSLASFGAHLATDLNPNSPLLRSLMLGSRRALSVPHLSILAEGDRVAGSRRHALVGGDIAIVRRCGHNTTLFDDGVARIVTQRVAQWA